MPFPGHQGRCFARKSSAPWAVAAIALLLLLASAPQSHAEAPTQGTPHSTASLSPRESAPRPASMGLAAAPDFVALQGAPSPNFDEQMGATFTQNFTSLTYNVTALAQADADGYGPGYLLNGLTPGGYWYQVGVSYHWPNSDGSYNPGFGFSYEVFASDGNSVYPTKGAGLGSFTGTVNSGDSVLLSLTFTGLDVQMLAKDWNTGATAEAIYSSQGDSSFLGDPFSPVNAHGFFTGPMTEWYHTAAYYGNEGQVAYSNGVVALTSAWMWIDEFDSAVSAPALFNNGTPSPVTIVDGQVYPFAAEGATMYLSAHRFVTGLSAGSSTLTLTPAAGEVSSSSFSATANYTSGGQPQTSPVTPGVNTLDADMGTMVTVSIAASSTSDFWVFNGTSGNKVTFAAGTNATYVYYHVVQETVSYRVAGGGQPLPGSLEPMLSYEEPPTVASAAPAAMTVMQMLGTTPVVIHAVVGSVASVATIPGAAGERWAASPQNWTVSTPNSLPDPIQLYHQYDVSIGYSVVGGGTPPEIPSFNSTAFGITAVITLSSNSTTGWFDAGGDYSFTNALNGTTSTERWLTSVGACQGCVGVGLPSGLTILAPNQQVKGEYVHQYYVDLAVNDGKGGGVSGSYSSTNGTGNISPGPGWLNAGLSITLAAKADNGWQFENWTGSGAGAYSGANATIEATMTGPLSENATFYPGLAIAADGGTNVAYSYGSTAGMVQAGTIKTLYVPPSTNVTLRATPSLFVYSFASWQGMGLTKSTKPTLAITVDSPVTVTGASSFALPVILGIVVVAAIVIILAVSLLVRSRRRRKQIDSSSPSNP
ncbi:MAG TPA: hypothetical protein VGS04_03545 [Nitrososphaerales archaeon]|nr:hypothetical protein [Nitrososphaerales archaeon]